MWCVVLAAVVGGWALAGTAQAAGPATTISLSLSPNSIVANGTSTSTATVNVTDGSVPPAGVAGEPVALSSSDSGETISPIKDNGDGTYTATITSSTTVGTPTITATDGTLSKTETLTQTTGPAANVAVTLDPSSIAADGATTTKATATVTDAQRNLLPNQTISFSSSDPSETIGPVIDAGTGTYTATITSSTTVGPATILATDGAVFGQATLTQTAGPPAIIALALNPASIVANGTSTSSATATVTDLQGHRLSGQAVKFSSSDSGQTVRPVADAGDGTYTATITSSTTVGSATIIATDGSASGQATVTQTVGPAAKVTVKLKPASVVADGISTTKATATVTDAQGRPLPNETVVFSSSDPGQKIGNATSGVDGTYTATITSSRTVGSPTITATDGSASGQATVTQTVGPAANVTATLTPASVVADGTSTTKATATVTDAEGRPLPNETVAFSSSDPKQKIGATKNHGDGMYTATITSSTTVGSPTITATDGAVSGRATLTQTVGPPATIAVQVNPGAIVADGTSIATATATVTDAQGHRVPTDTITFSSSDPGQFFGPVSTPGDGTYSARLRSSTAVGSATITATDSKNLSGHATLTQAAGPSQMSLVATPASVVTNQQLTLFAVVKTSSGSAAGTITFKNGPASIPGCLREPITPSNPTASCQTSFAASTSPERLTAVFTAGPTSTAPGASGATTVIVKRDLPSVSLAVPGSVQLGQSTMYSVTVAPPASRPGPVRPAGSVAFLDNGQPIPSCQGQIPVSGSANCTLAYTAIGQHTISTQYSGDANFAGSSSAPQTVNVVPVPVHVSGVVTSTMQWLFSFTRRYTRVRALSVKGAATPASVLVKCHGRGCPFAKHTAAVSKTKRCRYGGKPKCPTSGNINLARAFKKPLHIGATITVLISRPGWIGKYYRFVIRAGRPPRIQINCLAPGGTRPGVGCST